MVILLIAIELLYHIYGDRWDIHRLRAIHSSSVRYTANRINVRTQRPWDLSSHLSREDNDASQTGYKGVFQGPLGRSWVVMLVVERVQSGWRMGVAQEWRRLETGLDLRLFLRKLGRCMIALRFGGRGGDLKVRNLVFVPLGTGDG